ncbi:hypothetical protein FB451DRAFT_1471309 [Mycena latifolia]|nr:hypothetical protein FB451DRAFT_1471309 [Mycena latifolia]
MIAGTLLWHLDPGESEPTTNRRRREEAPSGQGQEDPEGPKAPPVAPLVYTGTVVEIGAKSRLWIVQQRFCSYYDLSGVATLNPSLCRRLAAWSLSSGSSWERILAGGEDGGEAGRGGKGGWRTGDVKGSDNSNVLMATQGAEPRLESNVSRVVLCGNRGLTGLFDVDSACIELFFAFRFTPTYQNVSPFIQSSRRELVKLLEPCAGSTGAIASPTSRFCIGPLDGTRLCRFSVRQQRLHRLLRTGYRSPTDIRTPIPGLFGGSAASRHHSQVLKRPGAGVIDETRPKLRHWTVFMALAEKSGAELGLRGWLPSSFPPNFMPAEFIDVRSSEYAQASQVDMGQLSTDIKFVRRTTAELSAEWCRRLASWPALLSNHIELTRWRPEYESRREEVMAINRERVESLSQRKHLPLDRVLQTMALRKVLRHFERDLTPVDFRTLDEISPVIKQEVQYLITSTTTTDIFIGKKGKTKARKSQSEMLDVFTNVQVRWRGFNWPLHIQSRSSFPSASLSLVPKKKFGARHLNHRDEYHVGHVYTSHHSLVSHRIVAQIELPPNFDGQISWQTQPSSNPTTPALVPPALDLRAWAQRNGWPMTEFVRSDNVDQGKVRFAGAAMMAIRALKDGGTITVGPHESHLLATALEKPAIGTILLSMLKIPPLAPLNAEQTFYPLIYALSMQGNSPYGSMPLVNEWVLQTLGPVLEVAYSAATEISSKHYKNLQKPVCAGM